MTENPQNRKDSEHNLYQAEQDKASDVKGYHTVEPNRADEGYTAENVFKRKGQSAPWPRTEKGDKGDHPGK